MSKAIILIAALLLVGCGRIPTQEERVARCSRMCAHLGEKIVVVQKGYDHRAWCMCSDGNWRRFKMNAWVAPDA